MGLYFNPIHQALYISLLASCTAAAGVCTCYPNLNPTPEPLICARVAGDMEAAGACGCVQHTSAKFYRDKPRTRLAKRGLAVSSKLIGVFRWRPLVRHPGGAAGPGDPELCTLCFS
jgi:hypothetical protein